MARYRFNHIKASIIMDTFPKVMQLAYPGVEYHLSKTDWVTYLGDGSEIWFCGLDDKERTEKVLGQEFSTIFLNECSQIPWTSREMIITRLAQRVLQHIEGKPAQLLKLRAYYDMNPGSMAHWTYRLFHQRLNPETKEPLHNPQDYAEFEMNPIDNLENLSPEYLETLKGLSARMQRRFLYGQYSEANPHALFDESIIDRWRVLDGDLPQMIRMVVAVDPSGSDDEDNLDNDEIGIMVVGLGMNGKAYVLEDCSLKAGPATWGGVGVGAYVRHKADVLVGEKNFGGAMVGQTIKVASQAQEVRCNFKLVTASRGKVARAEPFSALYEQGKVCHVGMFAKLEDELVSFSTIGYNGVGSPNRADACLVAGTMVTTQRGAVPIEQVTTDDLVLTREGLKGVEWSGMTRALADTVVLTLSNGDCIIGTGEHPVFVPGVGFVPMSEVEPGASVLTEAQVLECIQSKSNSTATGIDDILITPTGRDSAITGRSLAEAMDCSIAIFGRITMGLFQKACRYITGTATSSTTHSTILSACLQSSIRQSTPVQKGFLPTENSWNVQSKLRLFGIEVPRAGSGTERTDEKHGWIRHLKKLALAAVAASQSFRESKPEAKRSAVQLSAGTTCKRSQQENPARSVVAISSPQSTKRPPQPAALHVVRKTAGVSQAVYNLHVKECHEFVANGILVHNCIWALAELFPSVVAQPKEKPPQTQRRINMPTGNTGWMG